MIFKEEKRNKKAQFDEINIPGVLFALIGGGISIIVTAKMGGGIFLKLTGFLIAAVACYFIGGKIAESG